MLRRPKTAFPIAPCLYFCLSLFDERVGHRRGLYLIVSPRAAALSPATPRCSEWLRLRL